MYNDFFLKFSDAEHARSVIGTAPNGEITGIYKDCFLLLDQYEDCVIVSLRGEFLPSELSKYETSKPSSLVRVWA